MLKASCNKSTDDVWDKVRAATTPMVESLYSGCFLLYFYYQLLVLASVHIVLLSYMDQVSRVVGGWVRQKAGDRRISRTDASHFLTSSLLLFSFTHPPPHPPLPSTPPPPQKPSPPPPPPPPRLLMKSHLHLFFFLCISSCSNFLIVMEIRIKHI